MDSASTLPASTPRTTSQRIKSIFSGSVGNLVEWYDWYVYAAFSLYFAKAFFPQGDQTAQLLNTAAIFAVGFLMRPIGGWLMGIYADRKGRKAALLASVLLMCFGSLIIALTPSYQTIGVGAPILLVLARLLQGLSVGGEYGTSATYLSEMANKEQRGFFSSFQYVTLISGQLIALAVLIVLQQTLSVEQLESWGWRVPFFIGALCAVVAMYLRRGMEETESFSKKEKAKESLLRTLLRHPKEVLTVVGLTMGGTLAFYTYTTYMQKYLVNTVGMSKGLDHDLGRHAVPVHAAATHRRRTVGQDRPAPDPDRLRRTRHAVHLPDPQHSAHHRHLVGRVLPDHGRAGDRQRLHLDQRGGQSRTVPHRNPRPGRGPAVCADRVHLRRHR
ncbi:MAG: Alpha-ketoglutarate permease [Pseudomonas citronellolis]|nr:MAG: Alpha-ketoglutarate permease [Pseudomonas citronellolis]